MQDLSKYDHRRVLIKGKWDTNKEILVGPLMRDGVRGFHVYTALQPTDVTGKPLQQSVIVNRGWIADKFKNDKSHRTGEGDTIIEAMYREAPKKNYFTPENSPSKGQWLFPDVEQMADWTGSRPILFEQVYEGGFSEANIMASKGEPIGRAPEIELRNNHLEYIFTW